MNQKEWEESVKELERLERLQALDWFLEGLYNDLNALGYQGETADSVMEVLKQNKDKLIIKGNRYGKSF